MYIYSDGGRAAAGFKGTTGDCVTRAIAIATGKPYQEVYDLINEVAKSMGKGTVARTGVPKDVTQAVMKRLGFTWHPTMGIGTGCSVHLCKEELPPGVIVCRVSKHVVAVIDGVAYDNHDSTRDGKRCVYGYWSQP